MGQMCHHPARQGGDDRRDRQRVRDRICRLAPFRDRADRIQRRLDSAVDSPDIGIERLGQLRCYRSHHGGPGCMGAGRGPERVEDACILVQRVGGFCEFQLLRIGEMRRTGRRLPVTFDVDDDGTNCGEIRYRTAGYCMRNRDVQIVLVSGGDPAVLIQTIAAHEVGLDGLVRHVCGWGQHIAER